MTRISITPIIAAWIVWSQPTPEFEVASVKQGGDGRALRSGGPGTGIFREQDIVGMTGSEVYRNGARFRVPLTHLHNLFGAAAI